MQVFNDFTRLIDSHSVDKTQASSIKLAIGGTGIVWLIILLILAISPVFKKPEHYKTVQIMLEPVQKVEASKSEKTSAAVKKVPDATAKEAAAPKKTEKKQESAAQKKLEPAKTEPSKSETKLAPQKVEKPAPAQKTQEAPKPSAPKTQPQTTNQSSSSSSYKKVNPTYKKSMDELLEEQMNSKKSSKKDFDWDSMDDAVENSSSGSVQNNTAKTVAGASALSGTAGSAASQDSKVTSTTGKETKTNSSASGATTSALKNIEATEQTFDGNTGAGGNGLSSVSKVMAARSNDGKLSLSLSDGSARVLLEPKEPKIHISEEHSHLIDNKRTVTIEFMILPSGNIPKSKITFKPAALIPAEIQSEISDQISKKWRFAPADTEGVATFEYTIIKR